MKFYGDKLKEFRKKERYSAEQLAKKVGVSRLTLWKWEQGHFSPREEKIRELCKVLSISSSEISDIPVNTAENKEMNDVEALLVPFSDNGFGSIHKEQQAALKKVVQTSRELLKVSIIVNALLSSLDLIFYVKDSQLKYLTANNSFLTNASLPLDFHVKNKIDADFFSDDEAKQNEAVDLEVLRTGEASHKEGYIPGTRKRKWCLSSKHPIFDGNHNIIGVVGTFRDITEKKKNDAVKEMLELTLNNSSDIIWLYKKDRLVYLSDNIQNYIGISSKEALSNPKSKFDYIHESDLKQELNYNRLKTWPQKREYKIVRPDGQMIWIESLYSNNANKDLHIFIDRDITERKNSEVLRLMLEYAVNQSTNVVWLYDKNFKLIFVSDSFEKIFGYSTSYIFDKNYWFEKCLCEEYRDQEELLLASKKYPPVREFSILRNNKKVWIESTYHKASYSNEDCHLFIDRDITKLKNKIIQLQFLENIFDCSNAVFIVKEKKTFKPIYISDNYQSILPCSKAELYKSLGNELSAQKSNKSTSSNSLPVETFIKLKGSTLKKLSFESKIENNNYIIDIIFPHKDENGKIKSS